MVCTFRKFLAETRGAVAMEALIITPILAWAFVGSFVFFDAFRTYATSLKATYAVADVLSRELDWIYGSDIEGFAEIFQHITRNTSGSSMRVSQVAYDGTNLSIDWSYPTGGETRLRDSDVGDIADQIPIMASGERVILVETFVPYRPFINVGIDDFEFTNFTVTRPRFTGQLQFDDGTDPDCTSCNYGDGSDDGETAPDDELDEAA